MALFPPGKGGGQEVDYGYKGKGVTIHLLVEGGGLPLSALSTGASGNERDQVSKLFGKVHVYHGYGRPKKCPKEIHADKGYDSRELRLFLRIKGLRPVIPKRAWKNKRKPPGRKVPMSKSRWKIERCFSWIQRKFRRLTVRWERRTKYWNGFLQLAVIMIWVDKLICG